MVEAAARLRIPYQDAHRLVLTGRLIGGKEGSRWLVTLESVDRFNRERGDGAEPSESEQGAASR